MTILLIFGLGLALFGLHVPAEWICRSLWGRSLDHRMAENGRERRRRRLSPYNRNWPATARRGR